MLKIKFKSCLYYYDGVQIFEAIGDDSSGYIGVLTGGDIYIVIRSSFENINKFKLGEIDLIRLIEDRMAREYYVAKSNLSYGGDIEIEKQEGEIDEGCLPDADFFLNNIKMTKE